MTFCLCFHDFFFSLASAGVVFPSSAVVFTSLCREQQTHGWRKSQALKFRSSEIGPGLWERGVFFFPFYFYLWLRTDCLSSCTWQQP